MIKELGLMGSLSLDRAGLDDNEVDKDNDEDDSEEIDPTHTFNRVGQEIFEIWVSTLFAFSNYT
jgi:hypothetical protein